MTRPHRRLVGFIVLVVIGTLGFAGTASAHAILDSSSPAASTVVAQAPGEIALDFSEPVEERFASVRLFEAGESDREIDIDTPRRLSTDSSTVVASIPPIPDGLYVV
ncbi:MAG: copper resistance protein CopC, partial [Actinomycetota bacterium]